jgi:hypothetical protein
LRNWFKLSLLQRIPPSKVKWATNIRMKQMVLTRLRRELQVGKGFEDNVFAMQEGLFCYVCVRTCI